MNLLRLGGVLTNELLKNSKNVLLSVPMLCVSVGQIVLILLDMAYPNDGKQGDLDAN
jgi:hypothetical protein